MVLTVFVTPVGKVVMVTEPVPATDGLPVLDHTGDLEGDIDSDPDAVGVFDWVVEAVTVFVGWTEAEFFIEDVPQGLPDMVFEVAPDLVCVTETVDVLDDEIEAVVVVEAVVVLVGKAEKDDDPDCVFRPDPVDVHVFVLLGPGALDPVTVIVSEVESRLVLVIVVVPTGVFEGDSEPVTV